MSRDRANWVFDKGVLTAWFFAVAGSISHLAGGTTTLFLWLFLPVGVILTLLGVLALSRPDFREALNFRQGQLNIRKSLFSRVSGRPRRGFGKIESTVLLMSGVVFFLGDLAAGIGLGMF